MDLPNPGQETKPSVNQQKKENLSCRFCRSSRPQSEIKECKKIDQYLDLAKELKQHP